MSHLGSGGGADAGLLGAYVRSHEARTEQAMSGLSQPSFANNSVLLSSAQTCSAIGAPPRAFDVSAPGSAPAGLAQAVGNAWPQSQQVRTASVLDISRLAESCPSLAKSSKQLGSGMYSMPYAVENLNSASEPHMQRGPTSSWSDSGAAPSQGADSTQPSSAQQQEQHPKSSSLPQHLPAPAPQPSSSSPGIAAGDGHDATTMHVMSAPNGAAEPGSSRWQRKYYKYHMQRLQTTANHVLFYVVDVQDQAHLAIVGTDVRLSGHFVYCSLPGFKDGPPVRCTNRVKVMEWLAALGATDCADPDRVKVPAISREQLDMLLSSDPMFSKPKMDRDYTNWREEGGRLPDGRHFKAFFLIEEDTRQEKLVIVAEDSHRRDRRYTYKAVPDMGGFAFENGQAVKEWLDFVVGRTPAGPLARPLTRPRTTSTAQPRKTNVPKLANWKNAPQVTDTGLIVPSPFAHSPGRPNGPPSPGAGGNGTADSSGGISNLWAAGNHANSLSAPQSLQQLRGTGSGSMPAQSTSLGGALGPAPAAASTHTSTANGGLPSNTPSIAMPKSMTMLDSSSMAISPKYTTGPNTAPAAALAFHMPLSLNLTPFHSPQTAHANGNDGQAAASLRYINMPGQALQGMAGGVQGMQGATSLPTSSLMPAAATQPQGQLPSQPFPIESNSQPQQKMQLPTGPSQHQHRLPSSTGTISSSSMPLVVHVSEAALNLSAASAGNGSAPFVQPGSRILIVTNPSNDTSSMPTSASTGAGLSSTITTAAFAAPFTVAMVQQGPTGPDVVAAFTGHDVLLDWVMAVPEPADVARMDMWCERLAVVSTGTVGDPRAIDDTVRILEELEREKVNLRLLETTKVGGVVSMLCSHSDVRVASAALAVATAWRNMATAALTRANAAMQQQETTMQQHAAHHNGTAMAHEFNSDQTLTSMDSMEGPGAALSKIGKVANNTNGIALVNVTASAGGAGMDTVMGDSNAMVGPPSGSGTSGTRGSGLATVVLQGGGTGAWHQGNAGVRTMQQPGQFALNGSQMMAVMAGATANGLQFQLPGQPQQHQMVAGVGQQVWLTAQQQHMNGWSS